MKLSSELCCLKVSARFARHCKGGAKRFELVFCCLYFEISSRFFFKNFEAGCLEFRPTRIVPVFRVFNLTVYTSSFTCSCGISTHLLQSCTVHVIQGTGMYKMDMMLRRLMDRGK